MQSKLTPLRESIDETLESLVADTTDQISAQDAYRESVNNCPICDSLLTFHHHTDFQYRCVQEDAECDSCGIQVRTQRFHLQ